MRDRIEGAAAIAGSPSPLRYMPAALVAAAVVGALILTPKASLWARPWFYRLFLKSAGPPPPSTSAVLVTLDGDLAAAPGSSLPEAALVARLSKAILALHPSVLAVDLPAALSGTAAEESNLSGAVVLGGGFPAPPRPAPASQSPEAGLENLDDPGAPHVAFLGRSYYPHLDGQESLHLPSGSLQLPDSLPFRSATVAFSGPVGGSSPAPVFAVPAFVRAGRGVIASLGVEAARRALGVSAAQVNYVEGVGILFDPTHLLPVDANGDMLLRYHEASGMPSLPASRILDGSAAREEIQGKAVFVDAAGPGRPLARTVAGVLSQTELWATAASNVLEKTAVSAPSWGGILSVTLGAVFAVIVLAVHFADIGLAGTLLLAALLAAVYPLLSLWLFVKSSWWLPPELPALLVLGAYLPFGFTRLFAGGRDAKSSRPMAPIRPAPAFNPVQAGAVPPLFAPSTPAPAASLYSAPPSSASTPPPQARPAQAPMAPQAPAPRPTPARGIPQTPAAPSPIGEIPMARPQPSRERQGPQGSMPPQQPAPRLEGEFFKVPPESPSIPAPAPAAPKPPPAAVAAAAAASVMPHAHSGALGDDIERDAKGGLVRVGKYRIVRKMGFGSAGDVFEGFDTHMGRKVAIKTITKDAAAHFDRAAERFVIEARAAGSLNHPCINTIYDFGTIRDVSYMVLEFLDGITLSQWMRQSPVPAPRDVAPWIQQISSALDYAHSQKIIHRDLKPSNLMIVNGGTTVKLLDFGIAKLEDVGLTQTGMTVGTPSYMSPEQLTGSKVTAASDQYGLAVVIYQILTYKLPYQGTKIPELCNRILKNDLIPITDANPALGAPVWNALRKAMSKAPEERYANCMSLYQSLEAAFPAPQAFAPA